MSRKPVLVNEQTGAVSGGNLTKNQVTAAAPTVANDNTQGYAVGSRWTHSGTGTTYICTSAATGAAVWTAVTGVGDMAKATYDPTNKNADAFSMENMVEGATKKILSVAERAAIHTHPNLAQLDLITDGDHDVRTDNPHGTGGHNLVSTGQPVGKILVTNGAGAFTYEDPAPGGGTPGGVDTDIQFNSSGAFAGHTLDVAFKTNAYGSVAIKKGLDTTPYPGAAGKASLQVGFQFGGGPNPNALVGGPGDEGSITFGSILNAYGRGGYTDRLRANRGCLVGGSIGNTGSGITGDRAIQALSYYGAFALGSIHGTNNGTHTITASGRGSFAFGLVEAPADNILASGNGAFAFGKGAQATGDNCVQLFAGSNSRPKSLKVGTAYGYSGGLRLLGGAYTAAPASPEDGDIWVQRSGTYPTYTTELFCQTGGVIKNLSNI